MATKIFFHGNGVEAPVPSGGESPPVRGLFTTSREITVRARLRGGGSGTAKQLSPVSDPSQFLAYPRNCNQILVASLPSRVSARLRLLIQQCPLSGVKRTSCRCAVMSADDLGCVKTQKSQNRRELFFSDQAKANTLKNSRRYNCDSEKRSFYRRRAPLRFYTAKPSRDMRGSGLPRCKLIYGPYSASRDFLI